MVYFLVFEVKCEPVTGVKNTEKCNFSTEGVTNFVPYEVNFMAVNADQFRAEMTSHFFFEWKSPVISNCNSSLAPEEAAPVDVLNEPFAFEGDIVTSCKIF